MNNDDQEMRPEYPAELIKSGARGKYAKRYREGTNVVTIDPELNKLFPSAEAVNRALRRYAQEHKLLP
ncbi:MULTISPECIES: hypothetical protein [Thiocapsa]|uniref:Uncharacterized protein n=1 Tax=Thiocapsa roseopersicina TaxID=1058 RepID=A0A1H3BGF5_THIRO|nr:MULTISPECIES: hypothetical protein [Thiocapsa]SDX40781.1 hypothetical protein SAMN05421783_12475 [Thiocapsa roseopersicina]